MAWTNLTKRAIAYLITKANDVDLWIDNIHYLKGQAGVVEMEAGIKSDTDITDDLGAVDKRWANIHGRSLYANRYLITPAIREVRLTWEDAAPGSYQATFTATGAGSVANLGGTGQAVLKVDNDAGGARAARIDQLVEQNGALNNAWTVAKNPYMRVELSLNAEDAQAAVFIGFRTTPGILPPAIAGTEVYAGVRWDGGANWQVGTGNGANASASNLSTDPTAGSRNVIEIYITSGVSVEVWLNGILVGTKTTFLPTGSLEWSILVNTDGTGGASDSILTIGQVIMQETVP